LFSSVPSGPVRQASFGDFNGGSGGGFGQPPPQQYHQQQQQTYPSQTHSQQQQRPQQAIYGQPDSYNAPPTVQPNSQAGYASWNSGSSGVTSPIGGGGGMTTLSNGFAGMNMSMGNDPWSSTVPVSWEMVSDRTFLWVTADLAVFFGSISFSDSTG
jgi:hypothetical protein